MKKLLYIAITLIAAFSCTDNSQEDGAFLEVYIEDSPADFASLFITIEKLEILKGSEWVNLGYLSENFSIMEYTGGKSKKLIDRSIDPGLYSKFRIKFGANELKLLITNETDLKILTIDEDKQTLELPINVDAKNGRYYIMCDFDVVKSVDTVNMKLNPNVTVIDLNTAGAISGFIANQSETPIAEIALVEIESKSGELKSTYTNKTSGMFFARLTEGEYTVRITPNISSKFLKDTLRNIVVTKAKATELGRIKLKEKVVPKDEDE